MFTKEYNLLESNRFRYFFVFGGALFAFALLWIFEPFGIYNLPWDEKLKDLSLYIGVGLVVMYLQFFPIQKLLFKKFTLLTTILWILLSILNLAGSSSLINAFLFNDGHFYFSTFFYFQGIVLSINIVPVTLFVLLHYNYTLKSRLRISTKITESIHLKNKNPIATQSIQINSKNKSEGLNISVSSLLFIKSADNYIDIYFMDEGTVKHKLVRYSLSSIERDNKNETDIFRCHKSYIINKQNVNSISGNAAGYKLKINHYDTLIPVSRKLNNTIHTIF